MYSGHAMWFVALKMLVGDKARYLGIVLGVVFASLLITQQMSIFTGIMFRTFSTVTDTGYPEIWVMDKKVQYIDDVKPLQDTKLYTVRGVEGVDWAMPFYKGLLKARLADGRFQTVNLFGLDDATLVGGPPTMVEGRLEDLRRAEGVIVDENGARGRLAKPDPAGGPPIPLRVGDVLELNDHRAVVVGICRVGRTFQSQPVIYTTYSRAVSFAPRERKLLSFIVAGVKPHLDVEDVCKRIEEQTGLVALPANEFKWKSVFYYLKYTGIPINFGTAVLLGFLVGTAIAGQTFYNFTLDNLKQFGALKAMGASTWTLLGMILLQALVVGVVGYGIGVGIASTFGILSKNSELAFRLQWQILLVSAAAVVVICALSALLAIRKVVKLEPAIVFK
jgi:putative ABC transport system permease protein